MITVMNTDKENLQLTGLVKLVKISLYASEFPETPVCEESFKFNEDGFIVWKSGKIFTKYNDDRFEGITSMDKELQLSNIHLYIKLGQYCELFPDEITNIPLSIEKLIDRKFKKDEYGRISECIYFVPNHERIIEIISYQGNTELITYITRIQYEESNTTWAFQYNEDNQLKSIYLTNEGEFLEYWNLNYNENRLAEVTVFEEEDVISSKSEYHYSDEGWLNEVLIENDEKTVLVTFGQPEQITSAGSNLNIHRKILKIEERFLKGESITNTLEFYDERYINGDLWERKVKICSNVYIEKWSITHYHLWEIDYLKRRVTYKNKDISQITERSFRSSDKSNTNYNQQVTRFDEKGNVIYHAVYENNDIIAEVRKEYDDSYRVVLEEGRKNGKLYKYRFQYPDNYQFSKRAVYRDLLNPVWYPCECNIINREVFRYDTQWPNGKDHSYYFQYDTFGNIKMYRHESHDIDEMHLYLYSDTNQLVRHKLFNNNELSLDETFFYDRRGWMSEKLIKEYKDNKENEFSYKYNYESFDYKGNWLIREEIDNFNNIVRTSRLLEYRVL